MPEVIRSKSKQHGRLNTKIAWLIFGIIVNSVGLFGVVRWYGQFTDNQRQLTDIDESAFKIFANQAADEPVLTPAQRRLLKNSLTGQKVEDFLGLSALNNLKFKNLKTNYRPQPTTASPSTTASSTEVVEDFSGLVIGNPQPFSY